MMPQTVCKMLVSMLVVIGSTGCSSEQREVADRSRQAVDSPEHVADAVGLKTDDPSLRRVVREKAQDCTDALVQGDFPRFVDYAHPKLVQEAGGRDKMIARLKSGLKGLSKVVTVKSVEVAAPTQFTMAADDLIAIVPTIVEMDIPQMEKTGTMNSFLIGVSSDNGVNWTFVDGADLHEQRIRELLPELPEEFKLPETVSDVDDVIKEWLAEQKLNARRDMARSQLGILQNALKMYELTMRDYPTSAQGLEALRNSPVDMPQDREWRGPYLNRPLPTDPWDHPYQYEYAPGDAHPRVWSLGPDGLDGTADDVAAQWTLRQNWPDSTRV